MVHRQEVKLNSIAELSLRWSPEKYHDSSLSPKILRNFQFQIPNGSWDFSHMNPDRFYFSIKDLKKVILAREALFLMWKVSFLPSLCCAPHSSGSLW